MNSKTNILILSAGRRVELVQVFQEALKKHFPESKVYTTDLYPDISAACQVSDASFKAPRVTSDEYINFLIDICTNHKIGLVIPTIDTELIVLAKNKEKFNKIGTTVVIASQNLVEACRDKRESAKIFTSLAIDQPEIYDRDDIKFPCFCKPYDGSCSIGAMPIFNKDMLTNDILSDERNMFMELIGKEYKEYTIDAYYNKQGKLCCLVPRERLEIRAGEVSKGATRKNFVYKYLLNKLDKLKGGMGCITVQVFANPETESIKSLEINPRFGGGYPLAHAAGANYPEWLIQEYLLNKNIEFFDNWEDNLLMLRYDAKVIVHDKNK